MYIEFDDAPGQNFIRGPLLDVDPERLMPDSTNCLNRIANVLVEKSDVLERWDDH